MSSIVVMGVSGSGKSTTAELLAAQLGCPMLDGDSLHSAQNIERMRAGHALTDDDRRDWLALLANHVAAASHDGKLLVVACSALKRSYRDILRAADPRMIFVYLKGGKELIDLRLRQRRSHFMPPKLLDSQFETLEEPEADEGAVQCDIALSPAAIVSSIVAQIACRVDVAIKAPP
jgi:gluconokinase